MFRTARQSLFIYVALSGLAVIVIGSGLWFRSAMHRARHAITFNAHEIAPRVIRPAAHRSEQGFVPATPTFGLEIIHGADAKNPEKITADPEGVIKAAVHEVEKQFIALERENTEMFAVTFGKNFRRGLAFVQAPSEEQYQRYYDIISEVFSRLPPDVKAMNRTEEARMKLVQDFLNFPGQYKLISCSVQFDDSSDENRIISQRFHENLVHDKESVVLEGTRLSVHNFLHSIQLPSSVARRYSNVIEFTHDASPE
jgi:hypothetical protein